ncbi:MAG TPA: LPS export ABC transporter permease LptG [Aliidongia sp.]|nr:LPS export ABC transporter permease LptG [Aliidongia sp.]
MTGWATSQTGRFRTALLPSITPLDRYIQVATFRAFVLVTTALTALFSLLEFVEQLSSVGQGSYGVLDALLFVVLTAPARMLQVTPVSMLLGCLWALGGLARNSELTALRSLGFSEKRVIGSVALLIVPIVIILFLVAQFVIPPAQQLAQTTRAAALMTSETDSSFWAQDDHQYLNVEQFDGAKAARNVDIYAFTADGSLDSLIHADYADIQADDLWVLTGVTKKRPVAAGLETEHLATLDWKSFVTGPQITLLMLPVESMPPVGLYRYVHHLQQRKQQAIRYEQELWRKISIPFSMVAMIMIAAPFVFGSPRGQSMGRQIMIGAIFGIVFSLCQQIVGHLDLLLDLNPASTALAPSLVLMSLAAYLFRRAHR